MASPSDQSNEAQRWLAFAEEDLAYGRLGMADCRQHQRRIRQRDTSGMRHRDRAEAGHCCLTGGDPVDAVHEIERIGVAG